MGLNSTFISRASHHFVVFKPTTYLKKLISAGWMFKKCALQEKEKEKWWESVRVEEEIRDTMNANKIKQLMFI